MATINKHPKTAKVNDSTGIVTARPHKHNSMFQEISWTSNLTAASVTHIDWNLRCQGTCNNTYPLHMRSNIHLDLKTVTTNQFSVRESVHAKWIDDIQ